MKMKPAIRTDNEEMHLSRRAGWLRAAVLGSDDAIVSNGFAFQATLSSSDSVQFPW